MIRLVLMFCIITLISGCKNKNSESSNGVDPNHVKKEIKEAFEATDAYLNMKKEVVMEKAEATYSQLEKDTRKLASDMKNSGKATLQDLNSELNSKLNAAKQKLDSLQDAREKNLEKSKNAFDVAVNELKDAYQKSKAEFEKEKQQQE